MRQGLLSRHLHCSPECPPSIDPKQNSRACQTKERAKGCDAIVT
jgi:hypothetical protein